MYLDTPPCAQKTPSPPIVISTDEDLEEAMLAVEQGISLEPDTSSSD